MCSSHINENYIRTEEERFNEVTPLSPRLKARLSSVVDLDITSYQAFPYVPPIFFFFFAAVSYASIVNDHYVALVLAILLSNIQDVS